MATWHRNATWTPELAIRLADAIDTHGGHTPASSKLRAAAEHDSGILGQRAQAAYDAAQQTCTDEDFQRFKPIAAQILAEAMGAKISE